MSILIQDIIVLTIVFGTALYAIWSVVKSLHKKTASGCGDDCSCSAKSEIKKAILKKKVKLDGNNLGLDKGKIT